MRGKCSILLEIESRDEFQILQKNLDEKYVFIVSKNDFEKTEYFKFVDNIKYVLDQIDTVNLADPEHEFVIICNKSIAYINKKNQAMTQINDTMKTLNNTLQSLEKALDPLVSPIKEPLIRQAEPTLPKQ